MIEPITMYSAKCDGCNTKYKNPHYMHTVWANRDSAIKYVLRKGWLTMDGKLYCPECAEKIKGGQDE